MAEPTVVDDSAEPRPTSGAAVAGAGFMTMVALTFANGLQGGGSTAFAQSTDAIKHTFHINDAVLGIVPFGVSLVGNLGAILTAYFCARHRRTRVLGGMFLVWGSLFALAGLAPSHVFGLAAVGFAAFAFFRIASSAVEATDPAVYPLISDWWPVEGRATKMSIFNTLSAVGAIVGLLTAGILVDHGGWRWAFVLWLPIAVVGAVLIRAQGEPARGAQDVAYSERLEAETSGAEHDRVVEVVEHEGPTLAAEVDREIAESRWGALAAVLRLRSWRSVAIGIAITGMMGSGFMNWGLAYFKRTFGLSSTQAAGLAPLLALGAFAGVFAGGFIADRLLARGVLRARLYICAFGCAAGGLLLIAAFTTTRLAIAAPLLSIGSGLTALPTGPQFALMMDVTPAALRSQAAASFNILAASGALGSLLIGGLSTAYGENLRLALLTLSPLYLVGAAVILMARRTYVDDVARVVAEARATG